MFTSAQREICVDILKELRHNGSLPVHFPEELIAEVIDFTLYTVQIPLQAGTSFVFYPSAFTIELPLDRKQLWVYLLQADRELFMKKFEKEWKRFYDRNRSTGTST